MSKLLLVIALCVGLAGSAAAQAPETGLKVGDKAPDFALQGTDGRVHRLSDYQGKAVVLAWYPKASTQGCTIECKSLAENGHLIKKYDATYFMASVDPLEDNKKFGAEYKADFPLLSDPTREVATKYGVLNARGMANRWTFYIGKDGKILAIDKAVKPATSAEDMAAKLGELGVPTTSR